MGNSARTQSTSQKMISSSVASTSPETLPTHLVPRWPLLMWLRYQDSTHLASLPLA
ncbi:hypothetical protein QJS10_CPB11g01580 [Acorus calamus]|uniref:Uncharacterized protein n=1 Tax=Acorus calamus TaxID=4465 RepID=A0AAV9DVB6_ACOCL|nr:hypothetical protein QJS10_CPB11g01580 [Acorus calamus]